LTKWYERKDKIKDIFDSFRNYGICGAIFYVGGLLFTINSTSKGVEITYIIFGGIFILIAVLLFILNTINIKKNVINIKNQTISDFTFFAVIVLGIFLMIHSLLFLKNDDGVRLGEVPILGNTNATSE